MSAEIQSTAGYAWRIEDLDTDEMILNMGPQHPSTHGVLRLELRTDGEVVKGVRLHIGYLHRCMEKHAESVDYAGVIPYTDRLDYVAAMGNSLGYALAIEKLMGLEVSPYVQTVRVIMAELQRIASHCVAVGTYGMDLGAFTPFLHLLRDREKELLSEIRRTKEEWEKQQREIAKINTTALVEVGIRIVERISHTRVVCRQQNRQVEPYRVVITGYSGNLANVLLQHRH